MHVKDVRELTVQTLGELGMAGAIPTNEQLLIRNSLYIGCRFDFNQASVVWVEEARHLRFFDGEGKLFKILKLDAGNAAVVAKRAA